MNANQPKVTLVGAGPGDAGLLTLKGAERIRGADVVLYDRIIGAEILAMIPDTAEKIDVGKNAGNHPVSQGEINRLLLEKAKQGLQVVRLKGGDPFVFGRGGEELELLVENRIPFEVVPGVTSAIGGAAYGGIPVTHRDYASSLHIITGHAKNNEEPDIRYDALVQAQGTLVFLMGVSAIGEICEGCISAGMDGDMPAAIVENATTDAQRVITGTLRTLPALARESAVGSPAILVVGKVCELSGQYNWFNRRPLSGKHAVVAKAGADRSKLADRLRELGCRVTELPGAKTVPLTGAGCALEKALAQVESYSWLVFTSGAGVRIFFDYLREHRVDVRTLHRLKIACVGSETEKEIAKRGMVAHYRPDEYNGAALALGLADLVKGAASGEERLLIARAKEGAQDLTRILSAQGVPFDDVAIYETVRMAEPGSLRLRAEVFRSGPVEAQNAGAGAEQGGQSEQSGQPEQAAQLMMDFAAFTSSSGVESFAEAAAGLDLARVRAVCIGARTADTARKYGMDAVVPAQATIESLVQKIEELYTDGH